MGDAYKSKEIQLKGDPYIGVCIQALETLERLWRFRLLYRLGIDRDQCLHHSSKARTRGVNRDKGNGYKLLIHTIIKQEQLIRAKGEDSKVGELIYLLRGVVLRKFLSEILKKYTDLFQILKISSSSTDWLFFWIILTNWSTLNTFPLKNKSFSTKLFLKYRNVKKERQGGYRW